MKQPNQVKLYFQYNSNRFKHPQILLTDSGTKQQHLLSVNDHEFKLLLPVAGTHKIVLQLINKTDQDTLVDEDGNIVEDLWVKITKIEIDGFDITDKIDLISTYTDNYKNPVNTYGFLGFNTEYTLNLQTPGFYFIRNLTSIYEKDFASWHCSFSK
jgi:hypothetical protein